jgi:hypothetical protein
MIAEAEAEIAAGLLIPSCEVMCGSIALRTVGRWTPDDGFEDVAALFGRDGGQRRERWLAEFGQVNK